MILDSHVLDDERVPERELVVHRRERLEEILDECEYATRAIGDRNLFLTGPSGTGKTMLARLAVDLAKEQWGRRTAYVDCWEHYSRSDILYEIGDQLLDVPIDSDRYSRSEVLEQLKEDPQHHRHVVLDEADEIDEPGVLRDLYNCPKMQLIMIGHSEEGLWATVPDHVESRLRSGRLYEQDPYSTSELADLLSERADRALFDGVISDLQLERIARAAKGDARTAIKTLRIAAENAQADERAREISNDHIDAAVPRAESETYEENLERLTYDQEVLYEIVCEKAPIAPGDLYDEYRDRVDEPRVERTLRSYMTKLEHYDVVESHGNSSAKRFIPGNAEIEGKVVQDD